MSLTTILQRIKEAVGAAGCIADPRDEEPYLVEARGLYRGATRLVVRPGRPKRSPASISRLAGHPG